MGKLNNLPSVAQLIGGGAGMPVFVFPLGLFKIKVLAGQFHLKLLIATFSHVLMCHCVCVLIFSTNKDISPSGLGLTL